MDDLQCEQLVISRFNGTAEEKTEKRFSTSKSTEQIPGIALVDNLEVVFILDERAHLGASRQNKRNHISSQFLLILRRKSLILRKIWNLLRIGVEPLGQSELALPAEEENKLDRHLKKLSVFFCSLVFRNTWELILFLSVLSLPLCVAS